MAKQLVTTHAPRPHFAALFAMAALVVGLTPLAGCGFADPGSGTKSLLVQGELACDHASLTTDVRFEVLKDGLPAGDVNVTLIDADDRASVQAREVGTGTGVYTATWAGYHRHIEAQLWHGGDGLSFHIETPGKHVVTSPSAGAILAAKDELDVHWRAEDGVKADYVVTNLLSADASHVLAADHGHDKFALHELIGTTERVMVTRGNRLVPAGAAANSLVTSSYSVDAAVLRRTPE